MSLLVLVPLVPAGAEELPAPPGAASSPTAREAQDPRPTDRIIVKLADDAAAPGATDSAVAESVDQAVSEEAPAQAGEITAEVVETTADGAKVVELGEAVEVTDLEAAAVELEADPAVEYAEADMIVTASAAADDPSIASLWNITNVGAQAAWDRATGAGQVIAVVDTGIVDHPDLNTVPGIDLISTASSASSSVYLSSRDGNGWDRNPRDEGDWGRAGTCGAVEKTSSWHGTHVAGTAAAEANNGIGVTGVAPQARIMPVRVLGTCGSGYMSEVALGIRWASGEAVGGFAAPAEPAGVINLSLNFPGVCTETFQDAITAAHRRGSVVVSAAGNYNVPAETTSPASCLDNITVGAAGADEQRASYSNHGWAVDILAPGGAGYHAVHSTVDRGSYGPVAAAYGGNQGTSMAAPHVAGAAAVLRELDPSLSVHQIRTTLTETASGVPGAKHLDLAEAVAATPRTRIFADVDPGSQFGREIHYTHRAGLLNGWSDGTFRPGLRIERGAMAAVMYREAGSPAYTAPAVSSFRDVPPGTPFYKEIHWAKSRGLLNGWNDATFRPRSPINRDATAALLYRASGSPAYTAPAASSFTDVRRGQQFYQEIHWLAGTGISTGWNDGSFRPVANTNRDAMSAFLFRWDWEVR
jgi:subtilisin family serine protease